MINKWSEGLLIVAMRLAALSILLCVSGLAMLVPYWVYGYKIEPAIIAKQNALEVSKAKELQEIHNGKFSQKQYADEHQE